MQPLVKDPKVPLEQLVRELTDPKSLDAAGNQPGTSHADDVLDALNQKLMRVLRKATNKAETKPAIKQKLDELEQLWGVEPDQLHKQLHEMGPRQAGEYIKTHVNLIEQLNAVNALLGSERYPLIYEGEDSFEKRTQSYGVKDRPDDYLESFSTFIANQINQSAALAVVVNRPRDLSREQLREVRLLLDQHGYSDGCSTIKQAYYSI